MKEQEFKIFYENVKTYYPLNKDKTRYLILFLNGDFAFYDYDIERGILRRCNN